MKNSTPMRLGIIWILSTAVYAFQIWIFGYALPEISKDINIHVPTFGATNLNYLYMLFPVLFALASVFYFRRNEVNYAEDLTYAPAFIPFLTFVIYLAQQVSMAGINTVFN